MIKTLTRAVVALERIAHHLETLTFQAARIEGHLRALRTDGLELRLPRRAGGEEVS